MINRLLLCLPALALAACGPTDLEVRKGPQAVHPSAAAKPLTQPVPAAAAGDPVAIAKPYFEEFCVTPPDTAARRAAIAASGRFGMPQTYKTSFSTYTSYPILGVDRASITLVQGAGTGLICSVGVRNKGPSLFDDGRITISS
ncbi:hypothetical protein [Sulfitobacter sp. S190]|uniref:hypothetical protein n=1 Tax=Sulfitobacter sp. S190 TaxID=2867022 RepID=UPI0021A73EDE|nr:hypothetical protein [Sulfitobacter sp. S190]UWR21697.1 hypothetical protein K3756_13520 [Sulfitobacter sp. S190]